MAFPELFAVLRWWLVLLLLGTAAFPLSFTVFKKLPDRGYAFTKMFGLLLVAYFYWLTGSLGFLGNNTGGIFVSILVMSGVAYWVYKRSVDSRPLPVSSEQLPVNNQQSISDWVRSNSAHILVTELVFATLFVMWVWVRSQNPAIAATEKPMEIAFLNAIGRSPNFPPLDPWLSGFAISYYYFGYIMTSLIARLALVPEQIAFNLALAWLVAGTGTGAFGLVFNLLRLQGARKSALILGLAAALAVPIVGNLTIGLEVAHANGMGSPEFWQWLDVRDLNSAPLPDSPPRYESSSWWWWRSSRPLHEYHLSGRAEEGLEPIAEFPGFSFVLGDLHAHVLALPFAFLSLAAALAWWLQGRPEQGKENGSLAQWDSESFINHLQSLIRHTGIPLWLSSALILGGLAFLNTWDFLIHLFIILGAFFLARWRDEGWNLRILTQTFFVAGLLLIPAILLYLPFFLGFRSQAGAPYLLPMLMRPTRLAQWLIIFGMPLWAVVIFLVALVVRQRFRYWRTGLITALGLLIVLFAVAMLFSFIVASSAEGAGWVANLAAELGVPLNERPDQVFAIGWALSSIWALLPSYLGARFSYPALTLFLAAIVGMVVMIWRERLGPTQDNPNSEAASWQAKNDALPFVLLLIATGALLTIGPEFVYLRDNFGQRINTIFKFYYQAWVMFGVAALYALGYLWLAWRGSGRIVPVLATAGYTAALLVASLFPIFAVNSRALEYRGPVADGRLPATLDGLAQMARFNPGDYAAAQWLKENAAGTPVILEAVGGQYTNYGRISSATGLPTLLGWAGHEYQWRGATPEPAIREPVVRDIYSAQNIQAVADLLDNYDVRYIVVGGLERDTYGLLGMEKFSENLDVAFESDGVTIYYWTPQ
jgi:YYY domain-containing protein